MKLWEAIATGKPFKRPFWKNYIEPGDNRSSISLYIWRDSEKQFAVSQECFKYDDYELEPAKPREFFICKYPDGVIVSLSEKNAAIQKENGCEVIKVREVLE